MEQKKIDARLKQQRLGVLSNKPLIDFYQFDAFTNPDTFSEILKPSKAQKLYLVAFQTKSFWVIFQTAL